MTRPVRAIAISLLVFVPVLAVILDQREPTVLIKDEVRHYAYLRSMVLDADLEFENELRRTWPKYDERPWWVLETGRTPNEAAIGSAFLWAPGFAVAHVVVLAGRSIGLPWNADGYDRPYFVAALLVSSMMASVGVAAAYRLQRNAGVPWKPAACGIALVALGTHYWYWWVFPGYYAHANAIGLTALFVWFWQRSYGEERRLRWLLLGLLGGLIFLVRWQNIWLPVVAAALELVVRLWVRRGDSRTQDVTVVISRGLVFSLGLLLVAAPQFLAWKVLYGVWTPVVNGGSLLSHGSPYLLELLFSPRYGLLGFSPLLYVALAGLAIGAFSLRQQPVMWLAISYTAWALLLNGALTSGSWYGGATFGPRRLDSLFVVLCLGAGIAIWRATEASWRVRFTAVAVGALVAVTVTTVLAMAYRDERINQGMVGAGSYPDRAVSVILETFGWPPTLPAYLLEGYGLGLTPGQYTRLLDEEYVAWRRPLRLSAETAFHLGNGWDLRSDGAAITDTEAELFLYLMDLGYRYEDVTFTIRGTGDAGAGPVSLDINGSTIPGGSTRYSANARWQLTVMVPSRTLRAGVNSIVIRPPVPVASSSAERVPLIVREFTFEPHAPEIAVRTTETPPARD